MYACVRILNPTKICNFLEIDTTLIELYMHKIVVSILLFFALFVSNELRAEDIAQGVKVVVIDAGHGGAKYPGAIYRGITEKSLNLKVALKLGELIEKRMPEVKVVYTRTTDMQFSTDLNKDLQARAEIANKAGGDIFISIHANAARATSARGVETLIMGESPLEQRVNEAVLFANNKDEFIDMSNEATAAVVRAYIQNLQFTYGEYSEAMARLIQKNYAKSGRVARGIKRQPLKVLYATDMPSVLTEIGFMSNPEELKYMSSEKGQAEIAENLFCAVKEYAEFVRKSLLIDDSAARTSTPKSASQQAADVAKSAAETSASSKKPESTKPASESKTEQPKVEQPKAEQPKPAPAQPKTEQPKVEQPKPAPASAPAQPKTEDSKPVAEKPTVEKSAAEKPQSQQPQSVAAAKPSGRAFVVQIMASASKLSVNDARFGKQRGKVQEYLAEGAYKYKYCVGRYTDRNEAQKAAMALRSEFSGAFVIEVEGQKVVKR